MASRVQNGLIWLGFTGALALATAPVWRLWLFGFHPTIDEVLQLAICGGPITR
jgi:hypothetical protein